MQRISAAFALPLCSFKVERNKESTARVAIWRQLGVSRYTRRPLLIYLAKTTTRFAGNAAFFSFSIEATPWRAASADVTKERWQVCIWIPNT